MTTVGDGAFLADDTMVATYELGGGWLRIAPARIGKQAFLGNSGMTAPGRSVPKRGPGRRAVGGAEARRRRARRGSACRRCRCAGPSRRPTSSRTFDPPAAAEAGPGRGRAVPDRPGDVRGRARGAASSPRSRRLAGRVRVRRPRWPPAAGAARRRRSSPRAVATAGQVAAGRAGSGSPSARCGARSCGATSWPTPSSRCSPRRGSSAPSAGTPLLTVWLRTLGAKIGRGVWCETYWLPEADLVRLGDGATVNRGCVVQTHLFHDRVMSMDKVTLGAGATLGPARHRPARREHRRAHHGRARRRW